jgi:hypothetical protein
MVQVWWVLKVLVHPRRPIEHAHVSYTQSKDVTHTLGQVECQKLLFPFPKCIGSSKFFLPNMVGGERERERERRERANKKREPKKKKGEKENRRREFFSCTYKGQ